MPAQLYTAHEQPDVAAITLPDGGPTIRCSVFVDAATRRLVSVGVRVHENGSEHEVFRKVIQDVGAAEIGYGPDAPKIIAVGTTFHVHWLTGDVVLDAPTNPALRKATLDLAAYDTTPGWTQRGSIPVDEFCHDLKRLSDTEYLVAHFSGGAGVPRVRRMYANTWVDIEWSQPLVHAAVPRVLQLYTNGPDGTAIVVYERTGGAAGQIWCTRMGATNGLGQVHARVCTGFTDLHLFQATWATYSSTLAALLLEVSQPSSVAGSPAAGGLRIPAVAYGLVNLASAAMGAWGLDHHLRLLSGAWAFASDRETSIEPNVYAMIGYQNAGAGQFSQRRAWIANFDTSRWTAGPSYGNGLLAARPRPVSNLTLGDFDTRLSGISPGVSTVTGFIGRRVNQLSSACLGADAGYTLKTSYVVAVAFGKLMAISSFAEAPLQPVHASIKGVRFHPEEPWILYRYDTEPEADPGTYHGLSPFTVGAMFEAGIGAFIGGGTPAVYAGDTCESGYCWEPEIYSLEGSELPGNVDVGTHFYCATYERRDLRGALHRSAPSQPVPIDVGVEIGAVLTPQNVTISVSTLTLSMRDNVDHYPQASPVEIVIWRTAAGGTVFRRVFAQYGASNRPQDTPRNDPSTWEVTAVDAVSDASLGAQEILPYSLIGGQWTPLPPYQPPAFSCTAKWQNRVWGVSSQDGTVWYSHEILPEQGGTTPLPPEFNPSLVLRVDGLGQIVAMQEMDDALILFAESAIYAVTGWGADPTGAGSSLQVRTIITGVGCIEPRSVVLTTEGIFFQSYKGLYLLNRGQALEYITRGANVEDSVLEGGNVRGATHMPDRHEIRFVLDDEDGNPCVLLYDYQHDAWSHFTLPRGDLPGGTAALSRAAGSCAWQGTPGEALHVVIEQGAVLVEHSAADAAPYTDEDRNSADPIPLEVRMSWVHPSGLAGYQRTQRIVVHLAKPNASGVRVEVETDIDGTYANPLSETFTFATPAPASCECHLANQTGHAYRVRVYEITPVPASENLSVTGVTMLVGLRKGLRKR